MNGPGVSRRCRCHCQTISDLLWAAFGVNRADGRRTAPSAKNWQEIDIYVALPQGVYVFNGKAHCPRGRDCRDLRAATGLQGSFQRTHRDPGVRGGPRPHEGRNLAEDRDPGIRRPDAAFIKPERLSVLAPLRV